MRLADTGHGLNRIADEENRAMTMNQLNEADPATVGVVFTTSDDRPSGRPMPVRDAQGRVRVHNGDATVFGWARLADIEWTDGQA